MQPSMAVRRASELCKAVKGSDGLKPEGCSLLLKRGVLSVPNVRQGGPACHSLTTLRSAKLMSS